MSNFKEIARGRWKSILLRLGVSEEFLQNRHGPCPICEGTDRYRWDDKEGDGTYFCNGCGAGSGVDLLMKLNNWSFSEAAKEVEKIVGSCSEVKQKPQSDPSFRLKAIQQTAGKAGKEVQEYLRGRGLSKVPPGLMQGNVDYYDGMEKLGSYTAMLGKVVSPEGKPLTWHVTYLQDGKKADVTCPKKVMKALDKINGAAIRLYPLAEHIGIAEGIETAIAARELMGIPTWSVMNTNGMESFIVPEGVKKITIFGDNDKNYAGQVAAYSLGNRLIVRDGFDADVVLPTAYGDWLDILLEERVNG
ncbi:MAG TPA: hypothetical protein ENK38_02010 [Gammaproteobacteria bacterium]|nr:hypothetical protein [Gammaproteobacteria bacterium]